MNCHAQGKLCAGIDWLSYHSLLQLLHHCPPGDPLLEGESLARIHQRMAMLRARPGGEAAHDAAVKVVGFDPDRTCKEFLQVKTGESA